MGRTCLQSRVWLLQILNRAQAFLGLTFTVQRIQQIKAAPFVFSLNNSFEFKQTDLENVLQIQKGTYFYIETGLIFQTLKSWASANQSNTLLVMVVGDDGVSDDGGGDDDQSGQADKARPA